MTGNRTYERYSVRIPTELYDLIKVMSEHEHRSVNGQIITLLSEAVTTRCKIEAAIPERLRIVNGSEDAHQ